MRLVIAAATVAASGLLLAATAVLLAPQVHDFLTAVEAGDPPSLDFEPLASRSVVYAADGSVLAEFHSEEDRSPIPLDLVPEHVVNAVLAAEDERFWEHGALDLRAMGRALLSNLEGGGVIEGGSTITQQLVKNAFLTPDRDLERKIQEAFLAVRLQEQMSKEEILERYLNTVYFGNGAYGLQAAAQKYYRTNATDLDLGQGILLASLIRNPSGADPWLNPAGALSRRNVVIDRMSTLGHIRSDQVEELKALTLPEAPPEDPVSGSDYFVETVEQELLHNPRYGLGDTYQARYQKVFGGGLHIVTTLDPRAQEIAERKVGELLPDSGGQFTAALVSVDVANGAVRTMVGGPDFSRAQFNLVTQGGRQTGSSFKTFTLIAALESGYIVDDRIDGTAPCSIPNPGGGEDPWVVKNSGRGYVMTLTDATTYSVNCAYARLVKLVSPGKLVEVAHRMGVTADLPRQLSLTLGAGSVSPLDMASSYATLAADGVHHDPYFISSVRTSDGEELFRAAPQANRAISVEHARAVTEVLTNIPARGTGTAAAVPGWRVAGKTGSTDDNTDAWFVGFTPEMATAVWMGSPEGRVPMTNVGGIRVYGGTYPARIWGAYMTELLEGRSPIDFPPPPPDPNRRPGRYLLLAGETPPSAELPDEVDEIDDDTRPRVTIPDFDRPGITAPGQRNAIREEVADRLADAQRRRQGG